MAGFWRRLLLFTVFLAVLNFNFILAAETKLSNVLFENVVREIDLKTQVTKTTITIDLKNADTKSLSSINYVIDEKKVDNLSYIDAWVLSGGKRLKLKTSPDGRSSWRVDFKKPLEAGERMKIELRVSRTHELEPFPKEITQREKQLVRFTDNVYFYTQYVVAKQTTKVVLPSRNIRSFSKFKGHSLKDNVITYEFVESKQGLSQEDFTVHFENNNKFLTVTRLERLIEVSHWGNIAVEETIDLLHTGARLKGSFSRYEYSMQPGLGQPSVQSFDTILPASAADIYYRDDIGNISTSNIKIKRNSVDINLRPRFPLFGGWKTHYTLGYNVPSYEYLFNSNDEFVLNMRLVDHVFDDMVVDELLVKIVLPEGAKNFELEMPYQAEELPKSRYHSYLDTTGRPVISITKNNLVENHIQNFKLKYNFTKLMMFQEPLLVVTALYLLFLMVVICVRLDFSIEKKEEAKPEPEKKSHSAAKKTQ